MEKKIKKFKIVLAGPYKEVVGENLIIELNDYISKYKSRLVFLGPISFRKIFTFYNMLDVLILPSNDRLESFGLVQVEAMLANCPVVATNLAGVRVPITKTGMGILIESKNSKALARAIVRILLNGNKYHISASKIKSIFDYKKTINIYENIFSGKAIK